MTRSLAVLRSAALLGTVFSAQACRSTDDAPDAYGNFEATEVIVASQVAGPVLSFRVTEGTTATAGDVVAVIDTTASVLEREQLTAQRSAVLARRTELGEQLRVLGVQRDISLRVLERTRRLHAQQAATAQQIDQAERDYQTLTAQMDALRASQRSVGLESESVTARIAQTRDRVSRGTVTNPLTGTVLAVYARAGEVVGAGQPLYKIAALDTLDLRAWISGDQLGVVTLGQRVQVHVDGAGKSLRTVDGTVSWIASQGEFTPTPVQTRDERTSLVYAVKIRVANPDGMLKIGMPADVSFSPAGTP